MHNIMPFIPGKRFAARLLSGVMLGMVPGGTPPPLPPPSPFPPSPPSPPRSGGRRDFLIGLGCGLIPLLVAMAGLGGSFNASVSASSVFGILLVCGAALYVIQIITAIVFTVLERFRLVGLGLLTMAAINPVVFFIS